MSVSRTTVRNGRIELDAPDELPDGTEVLVDITPVPAGKIGLSESEWRDDPAALADWTAWLESIEPIPFAADDATRTIVWEIRFPRALTAWLVGAALGLSGAALQGLLRNPLADSGVLGLSGFAALGAVIAFAYGFAALAPAAALVFALGAALAGLAGAMVGALQSVQVGMGEPVLILAFVVIVIGGIGSIKGALAGAVLVGVIDTMGRFLLPKLFAMFMEPSQAATAGTAIASMLIYIVMAIILTLRPKGLFAANA